MRVGRQHPIANWLRCDANLYNSAMDQVLRLRDEDLKNGEHFITIESENLLINLATGQMPQLFDQYLQRKVSSDGEAKKGKGLCLLIWVDKLIEENWNKNNSLNLN